jgi:hypothetical protein
MLGQLSEKVNIYYQKSNLLGTQINMVETGLPPVLHDELLYAPQEGVLEQLTSLCHLYKLQMSILRKLKKYSNKLQKRMKTVSSQVLVKHEGDIDGSEEDDWSVYIVYMQNTIASRSNNTQTKGMLVNAIVTYSNDLLRFNSASVDLVKTMKHIHSKQTQQIRYSLECLYIRMGVLYDVCETQHHNTKHNDIITLMSRWRNILTVILSIPTIDVIALFSQTEAFLTDVLSEPSPDDSNNQSLFHNIITTCDEIYATLNNMRIYKNKPDGNVYESQLMTIRDSIRNSYNSFLLELRS